MRKLFWIAVLVPFGLLRLNLAPAEPACCYFAAKDEDINQPGQKAFVTWDPEEKVEAFTVQPRFEGNAKDFGMVISTPNKPGSIPCRANSSLSWRCSQSWSRWT